MGRVAIQKGLLLEEDFMFCSFRMKSFEDAERRSHPSVMTFPSFVGLGPQILIEQG